MYACLLIEYVRRLAVHHLRAFSSFLTTKGESSKPESGLPNSASTASNVS